MYHLYRLIQSELANYSQHKIKEILLSKGQPVNFTPSDIEPTEIPDVPGEQEQVESTQDADSTIDLRGTVDFGILDNFEVKLTE